MLSLLSRITHRLQPSFYSSTASYLVILGRADYSSLPESDWTPTQQYANKYTEARARRSATDPEYHKRLQAYWREYDRKNRDARTTYLRQYMQDHPEKRQAAREKSKLTIDFEQRYYAKKRIRRASDHHYHQRESLRTWIAQHSWVRQLTWPTHKLHYYSEKIVRHCVGCDRHRLRLMWWQDKKTDEFLCHPCFTSDWSRALPIGYEDKVFGRRKSSETKPGSTSKPEP